MSLSILMAAFLASAQAESVRPAVTQVSDARAVHLLFGQDGETVSNCVSTNDGWSCSSVETTNPTDIHLLVDTKLYALGTVAIEGPDLTVEQSKEGPVVRWTREVEPTDGRGDSMVVVRVTDPTSERAPMLNVEVGTISKEVGCADDGRFPDGIPNDGLFHCATVLKTSTLEGDAWSLGVAMRTQDGEGAALGQFSFSDFAGLHRVSVTVGDPTAASASGFPLVGPSAQAQPDEQEPAMEEPPSVAPEPPAPEHPPHMSEAFSPISSGKVWALVLAALGFGWFVGNRMSKRRPVYDAASALKVSPLDERGPVPDLGSIAVLSALPAETLIHVAQALTVIRRVLILGDLDDSVLAPIQSILRVTDPDRFAIRNLIQTLHTDGGLPPVLLILGKDSVLDTGGASPTPTRDLLDAIDQQTWCAVFVAEDDDASDLEERWGYDPQAGWSML